MRIVFIGSVKFSASALEKLISIGAEVVGIITKKESAFNADFFDLSWIAKENAIPYSYVSNINNEETKGWIYKLNPDVLFCFGWSNLIKKELLEIAPLGVVGFHPSLLPFNRGRHPLIWAKVLGLKFSGSTFFFMDQEADTGDILSQETFEINFEDDAQILYEKVTITALNQIEVLHAQLKSNTFKKITQDKQEGNNWRKRSIKDGSIDFRMSSESICNLVRGLTHPYVGAHLEHKDGVVKVWKVEPAEFTKERNNLEPGKVLGVKGTKLEIKTGDSSIWLIDHEFEDLPEIGTYIL